MGRLNCDRQPPMSAIRVGSARISRGPYESVDDALHALRGPLSEGRRIVLGKQDSRGREFVCAPVTSKVKGEGISRCGKVFVDACACDCAFQAFAKYYFGERVKKGYYIVRYKPHTHVDEDPNVTSARDIIQRRRLQGRRRLSNADVRDVFQHILDGPGGYTALAHAVRAVQCTPRELLPVYYDGRRPYISVVDRYRNAVLDFARARGTVPVFDF